MKSLALIGLLASVMNQQHGASLASFLRGLPRTDGSQRQGRKLGGNRATRYRRQLGFAAMHSR